MNVYLDYSCVVELFSIPKSTTRSCKHSFQPEYLPRHHKAYIIKISPRKRKLQKLAVPRWNYVEHNKNWLSSRYLELQERVTPAPLVISTATTMFHSPSVKLKKDDEKKIKQKDASFICSFLFFFFKFPFSFILLELILFLLEPRLFEQIEKQNSFYSLLHSYWIKRNHYRYRNSYNEYDRTEAHLSIRTCTWWNWSFLCSHNRTADKENSTRSNGIVFCSC